LPPRTFFRLGIQQGTQAFQLIAQAKQDPQIIAASIAGFQPAPSAGAHCGFALLLKRAISQA
jgi:hypothetical protein